MENETRIRTATQTRAKIGKGIIYFLLAVWAIMVLFPFYWMILSSVKTYSSYNSENVPKLCVFLSNLISACFWADA